MSDELDRLSAICSKAIADADITNCRADEAEPVVRAILAALRTPSEDAARAGGRAAIMASMDFQGQAFCGLAAMQAMVDHITSE